jgi:hypothetical protein
MYEALPTDDGALAKAAPKISGHHPDRMMAFRFFGEVFREILGSGTRCMRMAVSGESC